jgi:hypothetical protein
MIGKHTLIKKGKLPRKSSVKRIPLTGGMKILGGDEPKAKQVVYASINFTKGPSNLNPNSKPNKQNMSTPYQRVTYSPVNHFKTDALQRALSKEKHKKQVGARKIGRHHELHEPPNPVFQTNPIPGNQDPVNRGSRPGPKLPPRTGNIEALLREINDPKKTVGYINLEFGSNPDTTKQVEYKNLHLESGTPLASEELIAEKAKENAYKDFHKNQLEQYKQQTSNKAILTTIKTKFNSNKRNENKGSKIARSEIPQNIIDYLISKGYTGNVIEKTKKIMKQIQSNKRFRTSILPWKQKTTLKRNENALLAAEQGYLPSQSKPVNLFDTYLKSRGVVQQVNTTTLNETSEG